MTEKSCINCKNGYLMRGCTQNSRDNMSECIGYDHSLWKPKDKEYEEYIVKFIPNEHKGRNFDEIVFVDTYGRTVLNVCRGESASFDTLRVLTMIDKFR